MQKVKILKAIPCYMGIDKKEYGSYSIDQEVTLPDSEAEWMIKGKLAEALEDRDCKECKELTYGCQYHSKLAFDKAYEEQERKKGMDKFLELKYTQFGDTPMSKSNMIKLFKSIYIAGTKDTVALDKYLEDNAHDYMIENCPENYRGD